MNKFDITGKTYGYLTVIERHGLDNSRRNSTWLCKCKCGNYSIVTRSSLVSGKTVSCGCRQYESKNFTHNMSKTRIYREWRAMRRRCYKAQKNDFPNYQGKGIIVCDEWKDDFLAFRDWAYANGYSDDLTIDRIDNDKGYSPENCRWVTNAEQQRNKSTTIKILYNGEYRCLKTVCTEIGFPYKLAHQRYQKITRRGKEVSPEVLFAPSHPGVKHKL